jgi:hypothetical protein
VFRATLLSIVLTLAVEPNADLLCQSWCHPQTTDANECHHKNSTNSSAVAGDTNCDHVILTVGTFLRGEIRSDGPSPTLGHAVVVRPHQFAPLTTHTRPGQEPGREWWLETRPLSTVLRI